MDLTTLIDRRIRYVLGDVAQSIAGAIAHNSLSGLTQGHPHTQYPRASGEDFFGCVLAKSSAQSIPSGTWTAMTWDKERVDTGNFHAGTSAYLVAPRAGLYVITAYIYFAANATGKRVALVNLLSPPTTITASSLPVALGGISTLLSAATIWYASQGSQFYVNVYQDSGVALEANGFFSIALLR